MALLGGILGKVVAIGLLLVVLVVGFAVFAYATDYGVKAEVQDKQCSISPPFIVVKLKTFGNVDEVPVQAQQCFLMDRGNFVVYHIRTQHAVVYDREGGRCIYDSVTIVCQST
jgi:hypothetical protein